MTRELVLAAQTLWTTDDFVTRTAASAAAGFKAIGLRPVDYTRAQSAGHTGRDLRRILEEAELEVVELSALHGFTDRAGSEAEEDTLVRMATELGGKYLMATGEITDSLDRTAEQFGSLCDRVRPLGLRVALEFTPWSTIPDAATAWEIVRRSGRGNGGVIVDAWHHFRGARSESQLLAIPPDRVVALQVSDADEAVVGTLLDDTLHRRRLPGEGSFPLVDFFRTLEGNGVAAPISIEIISDEIHGLPPAQAARRAMEATQALLNEVDAGRGGGRDA